MESSMGLLEARDQPKLQGYQSLTKPGPKLASQGNAEDLI